MEERYTLVLKSKNFVNLILALWSKYRKTIINVFCRKNFQTFEGNFEKLKKTLLTSDTLSSIPSSKFYIQLDQPSHDLWFWSHSFQFHFRQNLRLWHVIQNNLNLGSEFSLLKFQPYHSKYFDLNLYIWFRNFQIEMNLLQKIFDPRKHKLCFRGFKYYIWNWSIKFSIKIDRTHFSQKIEFLLIIIIYNHIKKY